MEGREKKSSLSLSLSKKRDSLGRRLHLRRSLEDRKVDQEDAAAGEGPHAGKGGEGDGGGEEEELCVCVCGWVEREGGGGLIKEGVGAFFLWVRRRGFAPAPSHSPGYFQHACRRRPATAHAGTRRTRSGRGRPGGLGCGECVRENESERATLSGQACVLCSFLNSRKGPPRRPLPPKSPHAGKAAGIPPAQCGRNRCLRPGSLFERERECV